MGKHLNASIYSRFWESVLFATAAWVPNVFSGPVLRRLLYRGVMAGVADGVHIEPGVALAGAACITLGRRAYLEGGVRIDARGEKNRLMLGERVRLGAGVDVRGMDGTTIEIGAGTYIGPYTCLSGPGTLRIGRDCLIATHVGIFANSHVFADPQLPIRKQGMTCRGIIIEDDCWIGHGVSILDGVTIGRGSIIGAGAVVTRDIPPDAIAVGVPAKVIGTRREHSIAINREANGQDSQTPGRSTPASPHRADNRSQGGLVRGQILRGVLECIRTALAVDTVTVLLAASDGRHLRVHDSVGLEQEVEAGLCIPVGRGIAGRIAASGRSLLIEDLASTEVESPILRNRGLRQVLGTPLWIEERVVGVLHVGTRAAGRFGEEDRRRLQALAESLRPFVQPAL